MSLDVLWLKDSEVRAEIEERGREGAQPGTWPKLLLFPETSN